MYVRGITLVEMMIVIGGISLLAVLAIPLSIQFLQRQLLDETALDVVSYVNQAHIESLSGKNGETHGLFVEEDRMTVFVGSNFLTRTVALDRVYQFPLGIASPSDFEIVFSPIMGEGMSPRDILLQAGTFERTVHVNELGISYVR